MDESLEQSVERLHHLLIQLGREHNFRDPLAALTDLDVNPTELHTIMWLGNEGQLTMSVLAARLGATLPACTRVVDRLKLRGYVLRERDPHDRRMVQVRLAAKGHRLHERLQESVKAKFSFLLSSLPESDREQLLCILERLASKFTAQNGQADVPASAERAS